MQHKIFLPFRLEFNHPHRLMISPIWISLVQVIHFCNKTNWRNTIPYIKLIAIWQKKMMMTNWKLIIMMMKIKMKQLKKNLIYCCMKKISLICKNYLKRVPVCENVRILRIQLMTKGMAKMSNFITTRSSKEKIKALTKIKNVSNIFEITFFIG